jgi:TolB-like protein/Flp pilus assembly protein TadD
MVMGTAQYMSPEQARGQETDHRTDLWSLGVVLYEMLTGRVPFNGETPSHVIVSILESKARPLAWNARVPADVERIVSKALSKDRKKRYQTAGDLALDLKSLREDLTVESRLKQFRRVISRQTAMTSGVQSGLAAVSVSTASVAVTHLRSSAADLVNEIKRHRGSAVFASVSALLLVAALAYFSNLTKGDNQAIDSVAVLPFVNAGGNPDAEYLSDGISDSLIHSLSRLSNLRVISLNTVMRYKGKQIDPQVVGRELNVRAVLMGRMTQRGEGLTITMELVDVGDHSRIWDARHDSKQSDVLALQQEIAQEIIEKLRLRLSSPENQALIKQYTQNSEAYHAYLRGRYLLEKRTSDTTEKSIAYFEQAIKLDSDYALAYAALAYAQISRSLLGMRSPEEVMPEAKAAAAKALAIDDNLAEAHAAMGSVRFYEWDWAGAAREFRRANEINPIAQGFGEQSSTYLRVMKRFDDAVAESKRALQLDSTSVFRNRNVAVELYFARRYDEAIEQCQKTLELDPNMPSVYRWLGKAYEQKGLYQQAVEAFLKTAEFSALGPEAIDELKHAYAASGKKGFWRKALHLRQERIKQGERPRPNIFAEIYTRLGEKDKAFAWLEKGYELRVSWLTLLNSDPLFDDLRSDPRYADIVRRMGLEP